MVYAEILTCHADLRCCPFNSSACIFSVLFTAGVLVWLRFVISPRTQCIYAGLDTRCLWLYVSASVVSHQVSEVRIFKTLRSSRTLTFVGKV